jgi:hypothetical protein
MERVTQLYRKTTVFQHKVRLKKECSERTRTFSFRELLLRSSGIVDFAGHLGKMMGTNDSFGTAEPPKKKNFVQNERPALWAGVQTIKDKNIITSNNPFASKGNQGIFHYAGELQFCFPAEK